MAAFNDSTFPAMGIFTQRRQRQKAPLSGHFLVSNEEAGITSIILLLIIIPSFQMGRKQPDPPGLQLPDCSGKVVRIKKGNAEGGAMVERTTLGL